MVAIVVAHADGGVIGRDGDLPWHLPADLARFKALTLGGTVVMGRRTWDSLPAAVRPLPGRRNLVLSRDPAFAAPGAEVVGGLDAALAAAGDPCYVIGGASVYAEALPHATHVFATRIDADVAGDTRFPALGEEWRCVEQSPPQTEAGLTFTFRRYER